MRRVSRPLFIISVLIVSVSTLALSLKGVVPESKAASYNKACDNYDIQSRKNTICKSYPDDMVVSVATLPAAKDLKKNTLYLVSDNSEIETPYALQPGVGILPTPNKLNNLILTPSGPGFDHDCDRCVMKFAEGTKVAGVSVNLSSASWWPPRRFDTTYVNAVFYGSTTELEFSESEVWGRNDFDDLVYQRQTVRDGKMHSYHRLKLYSEGTPRLFRVVNTSQTAVQVPGNNSRHVDIVNCIGILSGTIPSTFLSQRGFMITNLVGMMYSSTILYDPLDSSHTYPRYGLLATDTPVLYLYRNSQRVTHKGYHRKQDIAEKYRNWHQSRMLVFSNDNSYFFSGGDHYVNELKDPSQLVYYLGDNELYASADMDTSSENIDRLTRHGGFFLGNAMLLESICPVNPGDYTVSYPLPAVNGVKIHYGPAKATVKDFYDFRTENPTQHSEDCEHPTKDWLIGGSTGLGIGAAVASVPWLISTIYLCMKIKAITNRIGYTSISHPL